MHTHSRMAIEYLGSLIEVVPQTQSPMQKHRRQRNAARSSPRIWKKSKTTWASQKVKRITRIDGSPIGWVLLLTSHRHLVRAPNPNSQTSRS